MAEEKDKKVVELEEKLEKARKVYKDLKEDLDKANERIAELESKGVPDTDGEVEKKLRERIKELEDEIEINGSSSEEIKSLNARLEKAKQVFGEQKEKIKALTEEVGNNEKCIAELEKLVNTREEERATVFNNANIMVESIKAAVEAFRESVR